MSSNDAVQSTLTPQHCKDEEGDDGGVEKDTGLSVIWILKSYAQSHVAMKQGLHCD